MLEVEFTPQGTLAEKIRAGGAGIPAFFTKTGLGTLIETGGMQIKRPSAEDPIEILSEPKPKFNFDGQDFIMERSIKGDFSLIKGLKADEIGNVIFHKSARNFNADCGTNGKVTIVEVEEIVPVGHLAPDEIHLPACYVDRIVLEKHC